MASEDIRIPCKVWPQRSVNGNAVPDQGDQSVNDFRPEGFLFKLDEIARVQWKMTLPFPTNVHATTPNCKLRVICWTPTAAAGNINWFAQALLVTRGTTSLDLTASLSSITVANSGQFRETSADFSLSGTGVASGKIFQGILERDARSSNGSDTYENLVLLTELLLVADT